MLHATVAALLVSALLPPPAYDSVAGAPEHGVQFERHVMGILGRMGCNSGSCHGSFQGRGGFRLSLFGYDPEKDYTALTRDPMARRVDSLDPDQSLILLKATGQVPHGGGKRFGRGSWAYNQFREWIQSGAQRGKGQGTLLGLVIKPAECVLNAPGEQAQLRVEAQFFGGAIEDVTHYCEFRSNDDGVVEASAGGQLTATRPGDTTVVVSYRGYVRTMRVLHPVPTQPGVSYPKTAAVNEIDREVLAKLERLRMIPADLSGDEEFLRRVTNRHHRHFADAFGNPGLLGRYESNQAPAMHRESADAPAACRGLGHTLLRHHRQQH